MKFNNRSSPLIIGMALFAMFFGSGNLIYPLFIGKIAEGGGWISSSLGFLISAVLLPFLGVIVMVIHRGNYLNFFSATIGRTASLLLCATLLTVWIPLGSAPRCITVAHASVSAFTSNGPSLALFSFFYSLLIFYIIVRKVGLLDILGRYITPLLLVCIGIIAAKGFFKIPELKTTNFLNFSQFLKGLIEGYNTMDLIASFFFSASVIKILNRSDGPVRNTLPLVIRSSLIGMAILAVVYLCLITLTAHNRVILDGISKEQLLAHLAQEILGRGWSVIAILAIILACFSTSIALILTYVDFLQSEIFKNVENSRILTLLALAATYIMSLFGLEGISYITVPILKVCYPILLGLIFFTLGKVLIEKSPAIVNSRLKVKR